MTERRKISRQITTFSNQRGNKFVKYNPVVHDPLFSKDVTTWCGGFVSTDKLNEVLDEYRIKDGLPTRSNTRVKRVGLQIYLTTTVSNGTLIVTGVVAWAKYLQSDYLYGDIKLLKRKALLLTDKKIESLFNTTKAKLRNMKSDILEDLLFTDSDHPTFESVDNVKKVGDLLILCVNPNANKSGLGRILFANFLHRAGNKYDNLLVNLGKKNGLYNPRMKSLAETFNFHVVDATFTRNNLNVEAVVFKGENGEKETFLTLDTQQELTLENNFVDYLDLDYIQLGTYTCSKNVPLDFNYATNGSKYTSQQEWTTHCGANKGYSNPYAGNYSL